MMSKLLLTLDNYISVNETKNPFCISKNEFVKINLRVLIEQYSIFPKNIISILKTATYNLNFFDYTELTQELIQNINEELGIYTDETLLVLPRPHYTILRKGIFDGLGVDINYTKPNPSTKEFINGLTNLVDDRNSFQVMGSVYAIESSAIPELNIVLELVKQLFKLSKKEVPKFLIEFFEYHINDIEIGHRDRFYKLCSEHLKTQENKKDFELGFRNVMETMDKWWLGMYDEIVKKEE